MTMPIAADGALVERLGWTLVHFLWQGALIGLLTASLLTILRQARAQSRYAVACLGLLAMLIAPVVTFAWLVPQPTTSALERSGTIPERQVRGMNQPLGSDRAVTMQVPSHAGAREREAFGTRAVAGRDASEIGTRFTSVAASGADETPFKRRAREIYRAGLASIDAALPWLVQVWTLGICALSLRLAGGLALIARMRRRGLRTASSDLQQRIAGLARRAGLSRRIALHISDYIDTPAAIGCLRPVVLLPASALSGLAPDQLEAVLAHELAHVRRHDYLVNLAQSIAETLLFYHPAVWYLSHQIRVEREHCCDDEAVAQCGDATTYASALAELELLRRGTPALAMTAIGSRTALLHRVRRLLTPTPQASTSAWSTSASLVAMTLLASLAAATHASLAAAPPQPGARQVPSSSASTPSLTPMPLLSPMPMTATPVPGQVPIAATTPHVEDQAQAEVQTGPGTEAQAEAWAGARAQTAADAAAAQTPVPAVTTTPWPGGPEPAPATAQTPTPTASATPSAASSAAPTAAASGTPTPTPRPDPDARGDAWPGAARHGTVPAARHSRDRATAYQFEMQEPPEPQVPPEPPVPAEPPVPRAPAAARAVLPSPPPPPPAQSTPTAPRRVFGVPAPPAPAPMPRAVLAPPTPPAAPAPAIADAPPAPPYPPAAIPMLPAAPSRMTAPARVSSLAAPRAVLALPTPPPPAPTTPRVPPPPPARAAIALSPAAVSPAQPVPPVPAPPAMPAPPRAAATLPVPPVPGAVRTRTGGPQPQMPAPPAPPAPAIAPAPAAPTAPPAPPSPPDADDEFYVRGAVAGDIRGGVSGGVGVGGSAGVGRGVGGGISGGVASGVGGGVSRGVAAGVAGGTGAGSGAGVGSGAGAGVGSGARAGRGAGVGSGAGAGAGVGVGDSTRGRSDRDSTFTMVTTDNNENRRVRGRGRVEFTDDDADVKSLTPGGYLDIEETTSAGTTRVMWDLQPNGAIRRRWWKDGHEASFEPEGRAWLAQRLPDLMRRSGLGADARIERILRQQGPDAVLNEVSRCPSAYVKRLYLTKLLDAQPLDAMTLTSLLAQTGREIKSDYDRRVVLVAAAAHRLPSDDAGLAYVDATRGIRSDYDRRTTLEALLNGARLSASVLRAVLVSTMEIHSAYDGRTVLERMAETQQLTGDLRQLYIDAADKLRSQYDRSRALAALSHNETATTAH